MKRKPHVACAGDGCDECCHLGHNPACEICLKPAGTWCHINLGDSKGNHYAWLCLDCYREAWHAGEIHHGQVLVRPMMADALARLLDKGTSA